MASTSGYRCRSGQPGVTIGITGWTQAVTDATTYDAFGVVVSHSGTTPTPFGYNGAAQYQTDNDSGLMLLGHRYYDSSIGRFISSDPAKAGTNWYAYCENNPLSRMDPSGHSFWGPFLEWIGRGLGLGLEGGAARLAGGATLGVIGIAVGYELHGWFEGREAARRLQKQIDNSPLYSGGGMRAGGHPGQDKRIIWNEQHPDEDYPGDSPK